MLRQKYLIREKARKKLNMCVTIYGTLDKRTLEVSQKVDEFIVQAMKERPEIKRILCKGFN